MSWIRPTTIEKLETVTKQLAKYHALLARHTQRDPTLESGGRCVVRMIELKEAEQEKLADLTNLTIQQANHLYT